MNDRNLNTSTFQHLLLTTLRMGGAIVVWWKVSNAICYDHVLPLMTSSKAHNMAYDSTTTESASSTATTVALSSVATNMFTIITDTPSIDHHLNSTSNSISSTATNMLTTLGTSAHPELLTFTTPLTDGSSFVSIFSVNHLISDTNCSSLGM